MLIPTTRSARCVAVFALLMFGLHAPTRAAAQPTQKVPGTVEQLWADFDPRGEPLAVQTVREWDEGGLTLRYVTYQIATFKGKTAVMAAYFAFPKGVKNLPGLVQVHGGGQRASLREVRRYAARGYACLSVNWGGRPMEDAKPGEPNTNWGAVDPTQNNVSGYSSLLPKANTIDTVESPRNNNWYLLTIGCRRGLTFLEAQANVDDDRLGVFGHSMGGRLTGLVAGSDRRVKAASPSVGGSGFLQHDLWGLPNSARRVRGNLDLFKVTIAGEAYLRRVNCPILFLNATNDFNAPMDFVERGMATVPHTNKRTVYSPHLNHRFTPETEIARPLWFDAHLKKRLTFPKSPVATLQLKTKRGVPVIHIKPDASRPIARVDVYYSYGRDPRNRYWTDAQASLDSQPSNGEEKHPPTWIADCPVFDLDEPLFVFANVYYKLSDTERRAGDPETFALSVARSANPDQLKAAGIKATEKTRTLIDDFKRGYHDWYQLSTNNPHWWLFATRKLADPRWEAPLGAKLQFSVETKGVNNTLAVVIDTDRWRSYTGRKPQIYFALVNLKKGGEHTIQLSPSDFKTSENKQLSDWFGITELQFRAGDKALRDANKMTSADNPFAGLKLEQWKGGVPVFKALRWVGGKPTQRRRAYLPGQQPTKKRTGLGGKEFQKAIDKSVELEKRD